MCGWRAGLLQALDLQAPALVELQVAGLVLTLQLKRARSLSVPFSIPGA